MNIQANYKKNVLGILMIDLENIPVDVTLHIRKFRDFLIAAWPSLDNIMEDHDWDNDVNFTENWMQANWEFLVERELLGKMKHLLGFETSHPFHRITEATSTADYVIIARPQHILFDLKQPDKIIPFEKKLRVSRFLRIKDNEFGTYPPFDVVKLTIDPKKEHFYVKFDDVHFFIDRHS
jgi:hypothetical protein